MHLSQFPISESKAPTAYCCVPLVDVRFSLVVLVVGRLGIIVFSIRWLVNEFKSPESSRVAISIVTVVMVREDA
jgi:lipid-A-disaccharide synthase-like uncharacterized protein